MSMDVFEVTGTGVVPGIAYAPAAWTRERPVLPTTTRVVVEEAREAEAERFKAASALVGERLAERASHASGVASNVLAATSKLATDRGWIRAALKLIKNGAAAEQAVVDATQQFVEAFTAAGGLMAERVTDLRDVRDRVMAELLGLPEPGVPTPDEPVILLSDDLAPADTAGLDPKLIRGIVTRFGGPTSHTSIIARQLGIPCVVAAADLASIPEHSPILLDGELGRLQIGGDAHEAEQLVVEDSHRREAIRTWRGPAQTADGVPVDLLANVQDGSAARTAAETSMAQGVGLFRTELCFLSSQTEPSVEEQARIYGEVYAAFPGKKVVLRTLDAGSDKPIPFANTIKEENPALGVRAIRLSQINPGLLERQLDAVAQAADDQDVSEPWVMAPMVATIDETKAFVELCRERGMHPGIMVEVPSVALMAEQFLAEVDFFSIGTNDLAQYTMAADRMSPELANLTDPWQPAVLRLIAMAAEAGQKMDKMVGVCGEAAASPQLACVLLGLGVGYLSMASSAIAAVGVQLGNVTMVQCQQAAQAALTSLTAAEARIVVKEILG
ncbi:MAG: phosphoenolpyruvate--protein phosphotransferase [Propionibacteriaceae bacterium]